VIRVGATEADLARELGVSCAADLDLVLERVEGRLQVRDTRPGAPGPLWVDFSAADVQRRIREGTRLPLARAVGLKRGQPAPRVADLTAGLGRDAYTLAALGCGVIAIERSPVLAALLQDGLSRAGPEVAARVRVVVGEALEVLPTLSALDVAYLDPMFPDDGKTALSRKHAQYLKALVAPEPESAERALFQAAWQVAARVVVKRPKSGPPLHDGVNHTLQGKTVRFDVYVRA